MVGLVHSLKNKKEVFMNVNDLAKQVSSIITPQTDNFFLLILSLLWERYPDRNRQYLSALFHGLIVRDKALTHSLQTFRSSHPVLTASP